MSMHRGLKHQQPQDHQMVLQRKACTTVQRTPLASPASEERLVLRSAAFGNDSVMTNEICCRYQELKSAVICWDPYTTCYTGQDGCVTVPGDRGGCCLHTYAGLPTSRQGLRAHCRGPSCWAAPPWSPPALRYHPGLSCWTALKTVAQTANHGQTKDMMSKFHCIYSQPCSWRSNPVAWWLWAGRASCTPPWCRPTQQRC